MKITCDYCGEVFYKHGRPNKKRGNYCCKEHRHLAAYKIYTCAICGKDFERKVSAMKRSKVAICGLECSSIYRAANFARLASIYNPVKMKNFGIREKIRNSHLSLGREGKRYAKVYGRHEHRVVAEQKIGRPLAPGEVVHHIDGNKRNNAPENLMVMLQSDHARLHMKQRYNEKRTIT